MPLPPGRLARRPTACTAQLSLEKNFSVVRLAPFFDTTFFATFFATFLGAFFATFFAAFLATFLAAFFGDDLEPLENMMGDTLELTTDRDKADWLTGATNASHETARKTRSRLSGDMWL